MVRYIKIATGNYRWGDRFNISSTRTTVTKLQKERISDQVLSQQAAVKNKHEASGEMKFLLSF